LRGLLREIGYADALLARREGDGLVLIDGHLRRSLDPDQLVPVLVLDLSAEEADLLLATLDPLATLAAPDPAALSELLARVETNSAGVRELLERIAHDAGLPRLVPLTDPDEIPALPETPRARRGDLYLLGEHRLLCGDATDGADMARLMGRDRARVLLTDPPYGVSYTGKTNRRLEICNDHERGLVPLLRGSFANCSGFLSPGAALYVFHPAGPLQLAFLQAFTDQGWELRSSLVWVKDRMVLGHSDYHYRHEPIAYGRTPGEGKRGRGGSGWYGGNSRDSVLEVRRPSASPEHPTAKPVELLRRLLVDTSIEGDVVLDPFSGSGATLVAAEITGRSARAMELDPRYVDVAVDRYRGLTGEKARRIRG
jgi:DNA modification methylase